MKLLTRIRLWWVARRVQWIVFRLRRAEAQRLRSRRLLAARSAEFFDLVTLEERLEDQLETR